MEDLKYWNALALFQKFGSARFERIRKYFSCMEEAFGASKKELKKALGEEGLSSEFVSWRSMIDVEREWAKLESEGIRIISIEDALYPAKLKNIFDPPALLYAKGRLDAEEEPAVAVVGTRKMTEYGKRAAMDIAGRLAAKGVAVISGLAMGIDAAGHRACLDAGGRTIAVLGSGVEARGIYPASNRRLAESILERDGAVISEFPVGTVPFRQNFPRRNRIVSGLSSGVLVIEAPIKSGSMITAKCALEQGREVFAVPGDIYKRNSEGPNYLIRMGAHPVSCADDIMEALGLGGSESRAEAKITADSEEEAALLEHLGREPLHIDRLQKLCRLDTASINSTLTMMEMKGKVKNLGNMEYVLVD